MTKVYLVLGYFWGGEHEIIDIFRSKDAAELFIKHTITKNKYDVCRSLLNSSCVWDSVTIEERNVN